MLCVHLSRQRAAESDGGAHETVCSCSSDGASRTIGKVAVIAVHSPKVLAPSEVLVGEVVTSVTGDTSDMPLCSRAVVFEGEESGPDVVARDGATPNLSAAAERDEIHLGSLARIALEESCREEDENFFGSLEMNWFVARSAFVNNIVIVIVIICREESLLFRDKDSILIMIQNVLIHYYCCSGSCCCC